MSNSEHLRARLDGATPLQRRLLQAISDAVEQSIAEGFVDAFEGGQLSLNRHDDIANVITSLLLGSIGGMLRVYYPDWRDQPWPDTRRKTDHLADAMRKSCRLIMRVSHPESPGYIPREGGHGG